MVLWERQIKTKEAMEKSDWWLNHLKEKGRIWVYQSSQLPAIPGITLHSWYLFPVSTLNESKRVMVKVGEAPRLHSSFLCPAPSFQTLVFLILFLSWFSLLLPLLSLPLPSLPPFPPPPCPALHLTVNLSPKEYVLRTSTVQGLCRLVGPKDAMP